MGEPKMKREQETPGVVVGEGLEERTKGLTPREIVRELDKYIIGQTKAKKAVAIALRNRWRRQQVKSDLRDEIVPNNIIMIGPTGVGKTEIARRLARLAQASFIKVEASKFTEVGYVGRDVESVIRDLTEIAVSMVRSEKVESVQQRAHELAIERVLDLLLPPVAGRIDEEAEEPESRPKTRERLRDMFLAGKLDERVIEVEVQRSAAPFVEVFTSAGVEEIDFNLQEALSGMFPKSKKRRKVKVKEAVHLLEQEEAQKLVDMDEVISEAIGRVQNSGIVFLDEIDKIVGTETSGGPDVSRGGVQRDLLPIVEGSNVMTKYGMVKTDHILFIAAGAFHAARPSDLIPEMQGRFPIRVELDSLTKDDFERILVEPENALIKQYAALLETEGVEIVFEEGAVKEIASFAVLVNERTEDIGARRLQTVMTTLLEQLLFEIPETKPTKITITAEIVRDTLKEIVEDEDLSRYIL